MTNFSENISALPEPNVHWKDFCDTVVRLGKSTSYSEPIELAAIYQKPYVGNTFCDFTEPAPVFTDVNQANHFIERLWAESAARLTHVQLLAKDSRNTSSPPSQDTIWAKAKRYANRSHQPSGKKQGAQIGHEGHWRKLVPVEDVDEVVACYAPDCCPRCKSPLPPGDIFSRKQVSYLVHKRHTITEFQRYQATCEDCGKTYKSNLPTGTPKGAFGACVHGVISTFSGRYHMSKRNIKDCLWDIFGLTLSTGSIANAEHTVTQSLVIPTDEVHEALKIAPVAHNDETSHYCKHKLSWLWVMGNNKLAYFAIQDKRNTEVAKGILGTEVTNIRITDRYSAYNFIPKKFRQYCWAHLKRDIKAIIDNEDTAQAAVGEQLEASRKAIFHAIRDYQEADAAQQPEHKNTLFQQMKAFCHALRRGLQLDKTPTSGFCRNLIRDWQCLWHFLRRVDVAPTNNHGERLLRHCVIWRKLSHGTQSENGNRYVERISTVNMTCRLQKKHLPSFLQNAVQAFWEGTTAPSLIT